jgi:hypothetical protein
MGVDETPIQVNGLLIVLCRFRKLPKDEMELCAMVIDVRVILIVRNGQVEVVSGGVFVACTTLQTHFKSIWSGANTKLRGRNGQLTELKMQASAFDVVLHEGRLQIDTLV